MAAKKKLNPQQQRDRRAKIMLGVLGAVLLLVLAIELPGMLGGSKSAAPPPAATATTPAAAPAAGASLATAAVVATPQTGQLRSFSRFTAKDPFHPLVRTGSSTPAGGSGGGSSLATTPAKSVSLPATPAGGSTTPSAPPTVTFAQTATTALAPTGPMVLGAVMKLNGVRRLVPVGASFPAAHPIFKLVAVGRKAIWISLLGGSFGNGQKSLKVDRGHPIKLVDTTAQLSYVLRLVRMMMLPKPPATPTPPASATLPTTTAATTTAATTTSAGN